MNRLQNHNLPKPSGLVVSSFYSVLPPSSREVPDATSRHSSTPPTRLATIFSPYQTAAPRATCRQSTGQQSTQYLRRKPIRRHCLRGKRDISIPKERETIWNSQVPTPNRIRDQKLLETPRWVQVLTNTVTGHRHTLADTIQVPPHDVDGGRGSFKAAVVPGLARERTTFNVSFHSFCAHSPTRCGIPSFVF